MFPIHFFFCFQGITSYSSLKGAVFSCLLRSRIGRRGLLSSGVHVGKNQRDGSKI